MFKICHVADFHGITHPDPKVYYELELEPFLNFIKNIKQLNVLVFSGDIFDTLYDGDQLQLKYILHFFIKLAEICAKKDIKLRLMEGTKSHDRGQLELLDFTKAICDSKIITGKVQYEEINGFTFRYIPEPYGDVAEFEISVRDRVSDFTFFHGSLLGHEWYIKANRKQEKGTTVIDPQLLEDYTSSLIRGGHFHNRSKYYTGSFSSNNFGDVGERKGWDLYTYVDGSVKTEFIENRGCRKFISINMTDYINTHGLPDIKRELAIALSKLGTYDKLRIEIDITNIPPDKSTGVNLLNVEFKDITFKITKNFINDEESYKKRQENYKAVFNESLESLILKRFKEKGGTLRDEILMEWIKDSDGR